MSNKLSDIKRAAEYQKGLDNYILHLKDADVRQTKRLIGGTRGPRRETSPAAVRPFGIELPAGEYLSIRVGTESLTELGTALSTRLVVATAELAAAKRMAKFRPARVTGFRGTGAAAYVQAKVTKLFYLKYTGETFSVPFGAISDTEKEATGGSAMKAAVLSRFGAADIKRISVTSEHVPV